jgi:dinuclear metal center YbgI/SA1388 family protein
MRLDDLVSYLDEYLRVREIGDDGNALNGLQVENGGEVRRIAVAVDACQAVIEQAGDQGADLLLVHHGLFWGGLEPIRGRQYRRLGALLRHDVALYAAHLPLDRHPEVGNNPVLLRQLGLEVRGWWGEYKGAPIGVWGETDVTRDAVAERIAATLGVIPRLLPGGGERVSRLGVITGAGGAMIRAAREAGLDMFVTGEGQHWTFHDAVEYGVNVLYAGHYATETVGVKALAAHLTERFQLPWSFIDHPTGL